MSFHCERSLVLLSLLAAAGCRDGGTPARVVSDVSSHAAAFAVGPEPGPGIRSPVPANPYEGDRSVLSEGRRLFGWFNCSGCHGDHGGGGMGPSLRDSTWLYGGQPGEIFASVVEGRSLGMPAWGTKIPADQIWKIVSYIKSLRSQDEPDPPR
jgi:cytochrome c oxidase cbb3-type subunit 3